MKSLIGRRIKSLLAYNLVIGLMLVACGSTERAESGRDILQVEESTASADEIARSQSTATAEPLYAADVGLKQPPTPIGFGQLLEIAVDPWASPVAVPLEIHIAAIGVKAAVLGVGVTEGEEMDAPNGPIGDPVWGSAFWYRDGGIPGDIGTATIAGHVNDTDGNPQIFADLADLQQGDVIVLHSTISNIDIRFLVYLVEVYSAGETSDLGLLTMIFGAGPVAGLGPQPSFDGLSHLNLITCAGNFVNGQLDQYVVVYSIRLD